MMDDFFPEQAATRPLWLITLADLALLLVGFFVFLQASQTLDRAALARGIREGFGVTADVAAAAMPVAAAAMDGFAPGSAVLPAAPDGIIAWVRDAARDKRVTLTITGSADGSTADVDAETGSGAVLAADRARAIAAALATERAVPASRLIVTTAYGAAHRRRGVFITTGFTGDQP